MIARLAVLFFLILIPVDGMAQCETYNNRGLEGDLDAIDEAFDQADLREAKARLKQISRRLSCIEERVTPRALARFGRSMSLASFYVQDEAGVVSWAQFSELADPELPWKEAYGPNHPWRVLIGEADAPIEGGPEGYTLAVPRGGAVFLDGHLLLTARTKAEIPHFVQVFDARGGFVHAWWQDGAAFPPEIIGEGTRAASPPRWLEGGPTAGPSPARTIVPLAVAGALLAGSGGLYIAASVSSGTLDDAATMSELTARRTKTNQLVVASSVVAGVAVGTGVTGALLSGRTVGFRVAF